MQWISKFYHFSFVIFKFCILAYMYSNFNSSNSLYICNKWRRVSRFYVSTFYNTSRTSIRYFYFSSVNILFFCPWIQFSIYCAYEISLLLWSNTTEDHRTSSCHQHANLRKRPLSYICSIIPPKHPQKSTIF